MTRISSKDPRAFTDVSDPTKILFPIADVQASTPGASYHMTGEQLKYMLASMDSIYDVTSYGASTSAAAAANVTAINDAGTAAAAVADPPYYRPTVYVPPGDFPVTTGITIPRGVNFVMAGGNFTTATVDDTQPVVTIGDDTGLNSGGVFTGLKVNCTSASTHLYDAGGDPTFAAVRFINPYGCMISSDRIAGTYIGLQLYAAGSSSYSAAYNEIRPGNINTTKIGLDIRAGDNSGAWANENWIFGGNFQVGTGMKNYGNCYGVRFSAASGGYAQQNHNKFEFCSFQMGDADATWVLIWSAGVAVIAGWRCYYNGNEYLAAGSGTTGATPPTHTSGTVSDGTVSWTYLGYYERVPFTFDSAGSRTIATGLRYETGIGEVAVWHGTIQDDRNEFHVDVFDNDFGSATSSLGDLKYATNVQIKCNSRLKQFGIDEPQELISDNFATRAIGSASGWVIAGMPWIGRTAHAVADTGSGASNIILCRRGINVTAAANNPGIIVDTSVWKRFQIHRDTFDDLGRLNFRALDEDMAVIDLGTSGTPTLPLALAATSATIISTYDYAMSGSDSNGRITVVVNDNTKYLVIWPSDCTIAGLRVQAIRDKGLTYGSTALVSPFGDPNSRQRRSLGAPTIGLFRTEGELIANVSAAVGQPAFWSVTTPGALAPAWVTTTAVIAGELRENSGHVYYADAAGTTGSTAPTVTSGSESDGAVTWNYLAPEAVLTASANLS